MVRVSIDFSSRQVYTAGDTVPEGNSIVANVKARRPGFLAGMSRLFGRSKLYRAQDGTRYFLNVNSLAGKMALTRSSQLTGSDKHTGIPSFPNIRKAAKRQIQQTFNGVNGLSLTNIMTRNWRILNPATGTSEPAFYSDDLFDDTTIVHCSARQWGSL